MFEIYITNILPRLALFITKYIFCVRIYIQLCIVRPQSYIRNGKYIQIPAIYSESLNSVEKCTEKSRKKHFFHLFAKCMILFRKDDVSFSLLVYHIAIVRIVHW